MIDNFSLGLAHGLMMLAAILLLRSPLLDREDSPRDAKTTRKSRWGKRDDA